MSEVLENAMLSLVERMEKLLPKIERLTAANGAAANENKNISAGLTSQAAKVPAMIQELQKQAERLEQTAKRVGEVKIPESVRVHHHTTYNSDPGVLQFLWIFFTVSLLLLAGAGFWVYHAVGEQAAAEKALEDYRTNYKPEQVKWTNGYVDYMIKKHRKETEDYIKKYGPVPEK
jgi:seryl-tRNA synthetase